MRLIIGLVGVKTSGKTTVTNMIREFVKAKEVSIADKLKNTCASTFGLKRSQFDFQELKEQPFENPFKLEMDDIKEILKDFSINMSDDELQKRYKDVVGTILETPRRIAQVVGTEVLRSTGDEDLHCKNVILDKERITIVSDIRFPNEFKYFNNLEGFKFIPLYINRNVAEANIDDHPSETSVFLFTDKCIKLDNNGKLSDTELQIKKILDKELLNAK